MKIKKWIISLAIACVCFVSTGVLAACEDGKFEAKFKENVKTNVQVNQCIDIEDYIVKVPDATYSVTFSYVDTNTNESQKDVLQGITYFFKYATDYTMRYTVKSGGATKSAELVFNVYGLAPTLSLDSAPMVYERGTTINLEALIENANPFYSPVDCSVRMESVSYQRETITLEKTIEEDTAFEQSLLDEETFTFENEGSYLFTLSVSSEYGTTKGTVRVEVLDKSEGNDDVLKENGEAVIYNAEVDGNTVRMLQGSERATVAYMVLDGTYTENDVFRFEFKGKNCPQIGLLTQADETSRNPYGLLSGTGYVFSFEDNYTDKFSIWGNTKMAQVPKVHGNMHNGNNSTGYFGYNNFEDDKYYSVEVKVFTPKKNTETNMSVYIYEYSGYHTENESVSLKYKATVGWGKREGHLSEGQVILYGSLKNNVCFKYYKPIAQDVDASTVSYDSTTKTLSWDAVEDALYHVSLDNSTYQPQSKNSYVLNVSFYGTQTVYIKTSQFRDPISYNVLMYPEGDADKISVGGNVPSVRYSDDCKKITAALASHHVSPTNRWENLNYVCTSKDYAANSNYIRLEFKGQEYAGNILFGVTNDPSQTIGNVYAYGLSLDLNKGGYYLNNASLKNLERKTFLEDATPYLNYGYLRENGEGGQKNFVMIIGTSAVEENDEKQISLGIWLYEKTGETEIKLLTQRSFRKTSTSPNETGKIMITSNFVTASQTKFTMWMPDTLENAQAALKADYTVVED